MKFHQILIEELSLNPHEVGQPDSFRNSGNKSVREDQILKEPNETPSNLDRGALPEPHKALENILHKNINRLIFAQLI